LWRPRGRGQGKENGGEIDRGTVRPIEVQERRELEKGYTLKDIPYVTCFILLGPTSYIFHHLPISH
jgi:hypothetical protein